jgi:segregation and condensation protein B
MSDPDESDIGAEGGFEAAEGAFETGAAEDGRAGEERGAEERAGEIRDTLFDAPPMAEQERMVEAILFASAEAISIRELEDRMPHGCDPAEALV